MDITATLNEINALKVEDRIPLVQAIWDSIAAEEAYPELSEEHKQELDNRIAESEANADNVMTWEDVRDSIGKR
ncbi:addiction module protein [Calothrix sp. CCY 0018]|uniref:addiction module protein n=1 Tax=Calothrix sp. CCY 0018 TaxID=3103864 RepID=UPI0039C5CBA9